MVFEVGTLDKPQGEEKHCGGREADETQKDNPSDCLASPALGEMNCQHALCSALCHCVRKTSTPPGGTWACEPLFTRTAPTGTLHKDSTHWQASGAQASLTLIRWKSDLCVLSLQLDARKEQRNKAHSRRYTSGTLTKIIGFKPHKNFLGANYYSHYFILF